MFAAIAKLENTGDIINVFIKLKFISDVVPYVVPLLLASELVLGFQLIFNPFEANALMNVTILMFVFLIFHIGILFFPSVVATCSCFGKYDNISIIGALVRTLVLFVFSVVCVFLRSSCVRNFSSEK